MNFYGLVDRNVMIGKRFKFVGHASVISKTKISKDGEQLTLVNTH